MSSWRFNTTVSKDVYNFSLEPSIADIWLLFRLETESITTHLASTLVPSVTEPNAHRSLCILDLCTGTGCIPLLLHALLSPNFSKLEIVGVDISQTAINLAENNKAHNIANRHLEELASKQVKFYKHNIFSKEFRESAWLSKENWDVVVSNPPYISQREFDNTTSRSVRKYEPKRALVPSRAVVSNDDLDGDAFYPYIIRLVTQTGAKSLLMEVADMTQATRVAQMVSKSGFWKHWEIWRDWPGQGKPAGKFMDTGGTSFIIRGEGNGRAVVAWS
ncbi:hypothetical protein MMC21_004819 [Puttea exsequens]|nr:hypothetical protein [Puttea exsequens]